MQFFFGNVSDWVPNFVEFRFRPLSFFSFPAPLWFTSFSSFLLLLLFLLPPFPLLFSLRHVPNTPSTFRAQCDLAPCQMFRLLQVSCTNLPRVHSCNRQDLILQNRNSMTRLKVPKRIVDTRSHLAHCRHTEAVLSLQRHLPQDLYHRFVGKARSLTRHINPDAQSLHSHSQLLSQHRRLPYSGPGVYPTLPSHHLYTMHPWSAPTKNRFYVVECPRHHLVH